MAPDAKAAWIEFYDVIESELVSGGELYDVRDVASKTADNAARIAALFQVFLHGGGAIGLDVFVSASRIAAWHLNESRRFFGELTLPTEIADAQRLDKWLTDFCMRGKTGTVPTKKVQQFGPHGLRTKAAIESALEELESLGRARLVKDGKCRSIAINPRLLEGE
jgi:putative DNA primase/helicase